jgi:hypothetical protein
MWNQKNSLDEPMQLELREKRRERSGNKRGGEKREEKRSQISRAVARAMGGHVFVTVMVAVVGGLSALTVKT